MDEVTHASTHEGYKAITKVQLKTWCSSELEVQKTAENYREFQCILG